MALFPKLALLVLRPMVGDFLPESVGKAAVLLHDHLVDPSQRLTKALASAQQRAWRCLYFSSHSRDRDRSLNDLRIVGLAMLNYESGSVGHKLPSKIDDLAPYLQDAPLVLERIVKGEIEVIWNALPLAEHLAGTSNVICAWDTKAGSNGERLVLFLDGHAQELTATQFAYTAKAATKVLNKKFK